MVRASSPRPTSALLAATYHWFLAKVVCNMAADHSLGAVRLRVPSGYE
jgi:hypothetical protein